MTRQIGVRKVRARACAGRGFTLVELLIVMLIIGLVISIVLPALGGARSAARNASTKATCNDLSGAIDIFKTDHADRMPGYFDAMTMARTENATRGFTALENALLELSGGVVTTGTNTLVVGPTAATTVQVDLDLLGADVQGNKVYYAPKGRNFVPQDGTENGTQASTEADIQRLPDVVDAWGNPILLWIENDAAVGPINDADDFARVNSGSSGNDVARFYWASNAGFLASDQLGKSGKSQRINSLLGSGEPDARRQSALVAMLGNPGFRQGTTMTYQDVLPSATRGRFAVHSAGPDGVFLGRKDKSGRQYTDGSGAMHYGFNWVNQTGQAHQDRNGNPTSIDILKDFDDTVISGGN